MKTLNWVSTGWFAKNFIFKMEQQIMGRMTLDSSWSFNALYTDKEANLKFSQKSFWNRDILIKKDGNTIGEIHSGLFGERTIYLVSGETYTLSTSLWEQEVYWKTENGETVITYQQAPISSMQKGLVSIEDSLSLETENILISSGLFVRQLARKRKILIVAIMLPIIAAAS